MLLIVEQIVEINRSLNTVKKVRLASLAVELPPVSAGDDFWFINHEDGLKRSRLVVLHSRMAFRDLPDKDLPDKDAYAGEHGKMLFESECVCVILDVIAPDLFLKHQRFGFNAKTYRDEFLKNAEAPAPDAVVLDIEAQPS